MDVYSHYGTTVLMLWLNQKPFQRRFEDMEMGNFHLNIKKSCVFTQLSINSARKKQTFSLLLALPLVRETFNPLQM